MSDFMGGRWPSHKSIPVEITEFCIAKEFGWTLDEIRSLEARDYERMTLLLDIYNKITRRENAQAARNIF